MVKMPSLMLDKKKLRDHFAVPYPPPPKKPVIDLQNQAPIFECRSSKTFL